MAPPPPPPFTLSFCFTSHFNTKPNQTQMSQILPLHSALCQYFFSVCLPPSRGFSEFLPLAGHLGFYRHADTSSPPAQSLVFVVLHFPGTSCYLSLFLSLLSTVYRWHKWAFSQRKAWSASTHPSFTLFLTPLRLRPYSWVSFYSTCPGGWDTLQA